MTERSLSHSVKKRLFIAGACLTVLGFIFFPGFSRYHKLKEEHQRLEREIRRLEAENRDLEEQRYKLQHDSEYIEKRAREKLGIVREDEIPYRSPVREQ